MPGSSGYKAARDWLLIQALRATFEVAGQISLGRFSTLLLSLIDRSRSENPHVLIWAARLQSARFFDWLAAAEYAEHLYELAVAGKWTPNYDDVHEIVLHLAYGHHGRTLQELQASNLLPDVPGYAHYVDGLALYCSGSSAWPKSFARAWAAYHSDFGDGEALAEYAAQSKSYSFLDGHEVGSVDAESGTPVTAQSDLPVIVVSADIKYFQIFFRGFVNDLGPEWNGRLHLGLVYAHDEDHDLLNTIREQCAQRDVRIWEFYSDGALSADASLARFHVARAIMGSEGRPVVVMDLDLLPGQGKLRAVLSTHAALTLSTDMIAGVPWARTNAGWCVFRPTPSAVQLLSEFCEIARHGQEVGLSWTADQAILNWVLREKQPDFWSSVVQLPHDFAHRLGRRVPWKTKKKKQRAKNQSLMRISLEELRTRRISAHVKTD